MKTLWIAEKGSSAAALRPFVGKGDVVLAAFGHLTEPKEPEEIAGQYRLWRVEDLPLFFDRLPRKVGRGMDGRSHRDRLQRFKAVLAECDRVVIATDLGREGSAIGWNILEWCGWRGRVERLKLGAMDGPSIERALAELRGTRESGDRDYAVAAEARCREFEDWHLGMNGTRAATKVMMPRALRGVWSFGGAQTPTLALLADHERRIMNFRPQGFFKVAMTVGTEGGHEVTLMHAPKERILDKEVAVAIRSCAELWEGRLKVEERDGRRRPPLWHSKDTLAQKAAKLWGWDPKKTLKVNQELYDGGYLTYPRTEGRYLPEGQVEQARAVLEVVAGAIGVRAPERPVIRRGKEGHYVKDELAGEHQAIVPTTRAPGRDDVSADGWRLYEYVARSFVAAHLEDGVDRQMAVTAAVKTERHGVREFSARGSHEKLAGWRAAFGVGGADDDDEVPPGKRDDREDEGTGRLPPVRDGEKGRTTGARVEEGVTKPPPRITLGQVPALLGRLIDYVDEPALKEALANPANPLQPKGIGTAATRESFVPKLLRSGYIELLKGRDPPIRVMPVGLAFIDALRQRAPEFCEPVSRAQFEFELAKISLAGSRDEIDERAASFRARTGERAARLVTSIKGGGAVSVPVGSDRPPQEKPSAPGRSRGRTGRTPRKAPGERKGGEVGARAATAKQVEWVERVTRARGVQPPAGWREDSRLASAFLDEQFKRTRGR